MTGDVPAQAVAGQRDPGKGLTRKESTSDDLFLYKDSYTVSMSSGLLRTGKIRGILDTYRQSQSTWGDSWHRGLARMMLEHASRTSNIRLTNSGREAARPLRAPMRIRMFGTSLVRYRCLVIRYGYIMNC